MKFTNLLLGSVTAAGLMTGASYAADLGVLTSVDVCDQLGLSGLTISSDTNCLKVSGEISYAFIYEAEQSDNSFANIDTVNGAVTWGYTASGNFDGDFYVTKSDVTAKLNFEATADSSFGPAKAVLKLVADDIGNGGGGVNVDEAFVSIGEGTVLMVGHKASLYNKGDDEPLNWLGLFNSESVNTGVTTYEIDRTSNAIQLTHDLGNGFAISGGLENIDDTNGDSRLNGGTLVGVLAYKTDAISAHVSLAAANVLEDLGYAGSWTLHSGISATLDTIKIVAAAATDSNSNWNVLGSAEASFDMFTLAGSVEAAADSEKSGNGFGASLTAEVAEGVKLNVGGRWQHWDRPDWSQSYESYEIAAGAEATVAENLTLSGAVGYVQPEGASFTFAWAKLAWAPGGGYTASIKGTAAANEDDETSYKIETEFKKSFD